MRARLTCLVVGFSLILTSACQPPSGAAEQATARQAPPQMAMTTDIPAAIMSPDSVETSIGTLEFFDGVPDEATVETVYDYIDRARAVEVFLNLVPSMSVYQLREGQRDAGATESHRMLIFDTLMDSRSLVLTGNTSTMYAIGFLDLQKDGPTVIELPTGMLGVLNDMGFLHMVDLGAAGPDQGRGGKYLVLPPGYEGDVPDGYFVVRSRTYGVWNFMRGYLDNGVEAASRNIRDNLRVYPLAQASEPPEMEFINASGKTFNTVVPGDISFYENLHQLLQEEPLEFLDVETRGLIASIGIVKGKPFDPDARMRAILTDAVAIADATARAVTYYPRYPGQFAFGDTDGTWIVPFADHDSTWIADGARKLEARLYYHYNCIVVTPAMAAAPGPGKGSEYAFASLDSERRLLDGAQSYRLRLPPNIPVADFWALTVYDTQTRSQLQTDQQFPTLDTYAEGLQQNDDGSYDIWFGPEAPAGLESNWLQTVPGKSWFVALRMYGPTEPWLEGTWRPGDVELVEP